MFEMHKKDLINRLEGVIGAYEAEKRRGMSGKLVLAQFFLYYFTKLVIPHDEKYDFWDIRPYLSKLFVDAFEELRTGSDIEIVSFRGKYEKEIGGEIPNILDAGDGNDLLKQISSVMNISSVVKDIFKGDSFSLQIEAYCRAQFTVIEQTFDNFLRRVFRNGMHSIIKVCLKSGMSGKFGKTELRTFTSAGRIMFTFARRKRGKTFIYGPDNKVIEVLPYQEQSISFVAEDGDPLCLGAGIQSVFCDFFTALNMINDVIKNWPADSETQWASYKADKDVSMF